MKKKYALFPGCLMPTEQYAYELSIRETLPVLGIELIDLEGFSCCGEPMKSVNQFLTLYLSARNLAISEIHHLDVFVPCAMCHLALSECQHVLEKNPEMKDRINILLAAEDLKYTNRQTIITALEAHLAPMGGLPDQALWEGPTVEAADEGLGVAEMPVLVDEE